MNDTYNQLKNELSVLYPDFTDVELNEATTNLINFYATAVKIALDNQKTKEFVVNDNNFFEEPH